mgnify:CR=1 FL=1
MSADSRAQALPFVGWARIWSPLASREVRDEAWDALGLPGCFADVEPAYWTAFHVGSPFANARNASSRFAPDEAAAPLAEICWCSSANAKPSQAPPTRIITVQRTLAL